MSDTTPEKQNPIHHYQFDVEGMSCAACVTNVESAIAAISGVEEISVNLATESASITSSQPVPIKKFIRAVSKMGYKLEPQGSSSLVSRQQRSIATWKKLLVTQAIFGLPLLVYAMLDMFLELHLFSRNTGILIQLSLATILVATGSGYYQRGFKHLILRVPNMDSLVALGTGSAYTYSLVSTLNLLLNWKMEGFTTLYFEAAGTILLFITFGKWLEAMARGKTTEALTGLMDQMPTQAEVNRDGSWITLPLEQIQSDDKIRVNPHTKIPVDGVVLEGISIVDESSISGESLPVDKQVGSQVIGASMNLQAGLIIRAQKIGRDSLFGQIIKLVEDAQSRKPEIQKLVDRIAAIFVPVVLTLAILSGLTWLLLGYELTFAINVMISVMIIACPCALGLATPTALVVGSGIAARGGILIKSADAFQQLSQIDVMVFDKTGTLTESRPQVVAIYPDDNSAVLDLAMGLERHSQHPLAKALLEYGQINSGQIAELTDIQEIPGQGISAHFQGSKIALAKVDETSSFPEGFRNKVTEYRKQGFTISGLFKNDRIAGLIAFSDTLKSESKTVIQTLEESGIATFLLTGDKSLVAQAVAQATGITNFEAEVLPGDKHDHIVAQKNEGKTVAMLGDGINDAPALVAADVGLSFQGGTDIAINAADIIFLNSSLKNVIYGHRIARSTISKIHQNLFWAFIYNLAGIPIAMGLLYPFTGILLNPMFAGMAMAFSSVSVVGNTLLLRSHKFFREF